MVGHGAENPSLQSEVVVLLTHDDTLTSFGRSKLSMMSMETMQSLVPASIELL